MKSGKPLRLVLYFLPAVIIITALLVNVQISGRNMPKVKNGILDLSGWNQEKNSAFHIEGEFAFYWNRLVTSADIRDGQVDFILVDAPDTWNNYEVGGKLPGGNGKATYAVHVVHAQEDVRYAVHVENMASVYRLYINDKLVAQNGSFGDRADAPVSEYRPQLASFMCTKDNFDIILQVSNEAYAVGGMWEPLLFGSDQSVTFIDNLQNLYPISPLAALP